MRNRLFLLGFATIVVHGAVGAAEYRAGEDTGDLYVEAALKMIAEYPAPQAK